MENTLDQKIKPDSAESLRLRIRGLCKGFGTSPVLDDLDLDVAAGELLAVLGPSGSGKTTLLRLVCGFEAEDAGTIELDGRLVANEGRLKIAPEKRGIGYVAQEGALFPHLSVHDNIAFGLARRERTTERVKVLLDLVGLPAAYRTRPPSALSGGEQQRVALARALAPAPSLILLDEPFTALDAGLRAETRAAAVASLKQAGASAVLVTHDQGEALSMGDKVAVMQNGRLAQVASPQTLYDCPANREIARFIGEAVLVPGTMTGHTVDCCFGRLPLAPQLQSTEATDRRAVNILIRPEQFRLAVDHALDSQAPGTHSAEVEQLHFYGHDASVQLRLQDGQSFTATVPGFDLPTVGQTVGFHVTGSVYTYPSEP